MSGGDEGTASLRRFHDERLAPISTTSAPGRAVATGTDYPAERQVLSTMAVVARALDVDELVDGTGLSIPQVLQVLFELEVKGRIQSLPGGLYRVV